MNQEKSAKDLSAPKKEALEAEETKNTEPEKSADKLSQNSPGVIVLQWLSYAFWGWLILALMWLIGIIAANVITRETSEGMVPYAIAATIVLLPIAFCTDFFYRRYEPTKKTGVATVIMVIHAVLFALLAIGSLVTTVFIALSMLIETHSSSSDGQLVGLWVLGSATVLYVLTFLRVLNPFKQSIFTKTFGFTMLGVSILLLAWGIVGPTLTSISLRDDRRIEQNLDQVKYAIDSYVDENQKLPDNLSQLTFESSYDEDAKSLIDDGLVRYKNDGLAPDTTSSLRRQLTSTSKKYRYQLCVTYKQASAKSKVRYIDYPESEGSGDYRSTLSTYSHPAGEVCYKLQKTVYDYDDDSLVSPSVIKNKN